jgi:hypothetical protein
MSAWKAVRRLAAAMLPWPGRPQRKRAIAAARAEAAQSRRRASDAQQVTDDIARMTAGNHFAESIARQITQGRS